MPWLSPLQQQQRQARHGGVLARQAKSLPMIGMSW